jgi:hypothetical protein
MAVDISEQRLLASSAVIEGAPYLLQARAAMPSDLYGLKCASSQSQNCGGNGCSIEDRVR